MSDLRSAAQASSTEELVDEVLTEQLGERLVVLARLDDDASFESLREAGVIRVALDGELFRLDEVSEDAWSAATLRSSVIDRIRSQNGRKPRLRESIARAFKSGSGVITLSFDKVTVASVVTRGARLVRRRLRRPMPRFLTLVSQLLNVGRVRAVESLRG